MEWALDPCKTAEDRGTTTTETKTMAEATGAAVGTTSRTTPEATGGQQDLAPTEEVAEAVATPASASNSCGATATWARTASTCIRRKSGRTCPNLLRKIQLYRSQTHKGGTDHGIKSPHKDCSQVSRC